MPKIIVYTTPTCPFCVTVKRYLKEKGLEFEELNVAQDREALKALREKTGQMGVPVIDIDGTILIGFNREKIDAALESGSRTEA